MLPVLLFTIFVLCVSQHASAGQIEPSIIDEIPGAQTSQTVTVYLNQQPGTDNKGPSKPGYIGIIEQTLMGSEKLNPVVAFRGIPFAQPPIGSLRYKPPAPYKETELRQAFQFKSQCLQWDLFRNNGNVTGSEDCLHLNVFKVHSLPDVSNTGKRTDVLLPVMVFFHGVGFVAGQSDTYNPEYLVQKGVIVVTVDYRLGALGFLSTGDALQPGNMGMLDQVEALRWVQRNIKVFGGDPAKVTIFGESAGAVAVTLHLVSPLTKGLFSSAIIQSGTALAPHAIQRHPMTHIQRLAGSLGCISGSTQELLDCIKYSDPREVIASDANAIASSNGNERKSNRSYKKSPNPGPSIQYETAEGWATYLPEDPIIAIQEGRFHQVPVIIGINRDESASAVINNLLPRLANISTSDPTYPDRVFLKKLMKSSGIFNNTEFIKSAIKFEYFKNYPLSDVSELRDEYINLHSDFSVVAPVYKTALYLSRNTSVYFYTFEYEGEHSFEEVLTTQGKETRREPVEKLRRKRETATLVRKEAELIGVEITPELAEELEKLGDAAGEHGTFQYEEHTRYVIHGEELLYIFRFRNPSSSTIVQIEDEEGQQVRDIMTTLWTNLAKFGSPSTVISNSETGVGSSPQIIWKPFSEPGPYTLKITDKTTLLISYRHRKMLFWTHYLPGLERIQPCIA